MTTKFENLVANLAEFIDPKKDPSLSDLASKLKSVTAGVDRLSELLETLKIEKELAPKVVKTLDRTEFSHQGKIMFLDAHCPGIFNLGYSPEPPKTGLFSKSAIESWNAQNAQPVNSEYEDVTLRN